MKNLILAIAGIVFIGNVQANNIFTEQQRELMIEVVPEKLVSVWTDPYIKSCWGQALTGSDKALAALYLIGSGQETIDDIAAKRLAILSAGKSQKEIQLAMRKSFNKNDYRRLERAVTGIPKSWKYCETVHIKIIERNNKINNK